MPREERDYSHRSLIDKLGVLARHHVAVLGTVDAAFAQLLASSLEHSASRALRGSYDIIFLQVDTVKELAKIPRCAQHLKAAGGLWIFHPKGKGASPSDSEVRAAGLAAGLVDNKICGYTATHAATRYVIPRALR